MIFSFASLIYNIKQAFFIAKIWYKSQKLCCRKSISYFQCLHPFEKLKYLNMSTNFEKVSLLKEEEKVNTFLLSNEALQITGV
jgi:hypothetical protein